MQKNILNGLALLASIGSAGALKCANKDEYVEVSESHLQRLSTRQDQTHAVDVYFHIASTNANKDLITDETVDTQFDVLQKAFEPQGFDLSLVNTSRIVDDVAGTGFYGEDGSIPDFDAYIAFLAANRRGGYDSLNVYFFSDLTEGLGGSCNLPTPAASYPNTTSFFQDGCILNGNTMPGMPARGDDSTDEPRKGHVAIHEVGHWFGLYHTFQGRPCDGINDQVDDTPAQNGYTSGCPATRDSCPDATGEDPIHNYMDYSDDTCTNEFTPGQRERMQTQFTIYRRY